MLDDLTAFRNARLKLWARLGLVGLAALLVLAGAAVLAPVSAVTPPGLELELSLADDSDNVVPAGSTVTVRAVLKYTGSSEYALEAGGGSLYVSGNLDWESAGRIKLTVDGQKVRGGAYGPWTDGPDGGKLTALDESTLVVGGTGITVVNLDTQQTCFESAPTAAQINAARDLTSGNVYQGSDPASATATQSASGFGRSVAVWHEDEDTAWIFVGSKYDRVATHTNIGRFYIYKADWTESDCDDIVSLERSIEPLKGDYENDYNYAYDGGSAKALFGSSVAVSANGKFLAVTSAEINEIGAVYVYERPGLRTPTHGPSGTTTDSGGDWADWGDLVQPSAIKLTTIAVPDWDATGGVYTTTAGAPAQGTVGQPGYVAAVIRVPTNLINWNPACNAACQRIWSYAYTDFGKGALAISEDGLTVAVGAETKNKPETWTPGRFAYYWPPCTAFPCTPADFDWEGHFRNGEAYVFTPGTAEAAEGYWRPTNNNAGNRHIDFRSLAPGGGLLTHKLQAQPFGEGPGVQNFGARIDVSNDGRSVAVTAPGRPPAGIDPHVDSYLKKTPDPEGKVYVFNRPGASWPHGGLDSSPDATFQLAADIATTNFSAHAVDFSPDGRRLAIADDRGLAGGRTWIFEGVSGAWRSATTAGATELAAPLPYLNRFGRATFELGGGDANSGGRLVVGHRSDYLWVYDSDLNILPNPENGQGCRFDRVDGVALNGDDAFTCELTLPDSRIVIPMGTPDGTFMISGSVTVDDQTFTDTLNVQVGTVDEVSQIEFDFDTQADGTPYPASVARVGTTSTQMLLKILNENGGASARGSISSVFFTTSRGRLTASVAGKSGACSSSGGLSCRLANVGTTLTASNADQIRLTLTAPSDAQPGAATVRAHVVSTAGQSFSERLSVQIAGAFKTLRIGEPSTSLLNVGTPDSGVNLDNRDIVLLSVTAEDNGGNPILVPGTEPTMMNGRELPIPDHRLTIKGPAGKSNPSGIGARWLPNAAGASLQLDARGNPQIEIDVDASAEAALPSGEYTIEAQVARQTWSQTFRVSSGPAELALAVSASEVAVGSQITVTATLTDADGQPVVDGTAVEFTEQSVGSGAVLILASQSTQRTMDGQATAQVWAASAGSAYVKAEADGIADLELIQAVDASAPADATGLAAELTNTEPNEFAVWLSDQETRASSLLPRLDGVDSILLWVEGRWLRYAVVDNQLVPGSMDFELPQGAVLWLANGGG